LAIIVVNIVGYVLSEQSREKTRVTVSVLDLCIIVVAIIFLIFL